MLYKTNYMSAYQVLGTIANNYQIVNRADVGGHYQGTWGTAQAFWVTIVRKLTTTPTGLLN